MLCYIAYWVIFLRLHYNISMHFAVVCSCKAYVLIIFIHLKVYSFQLTDRGQFSVFSTHEGIIMLMRVKFSMEESTIDVWEPAHRDSMSPALDRNSRGRWVIFSVIESVLWVPLSALTISVSVTGKASHPGPWKLCQLWSLYWNSWTMKLWDNFQGNFQVFQPMRAVLC